MPPKAYRWVGEMDEVAETFSSEVGFSKDLYHGAAEVFKVICDETILKDERPHRRERGQTVDDVAMLMLDTMQTRQEQLAPERDLTASNHTGSTGLEAGVIGLKVSEDAEGSAVESASK